MILKAVSCELSDECGVHCLNKLSKCIFHEAILLLIDKRHICHILFAFFMTKACKYIVNKH